MTFDLYCGPEIVGRYVATEDRSTAGHLLGYDAKLDCPQCGERLYAVWFPGDKQGLHNRRATHRAIREE